MLEEIIFRSVSKMDDCRTSLAKVFHLEKLRNRNSASDDSASDLYFRSKEKFLNGNPFFFSVSILM
ncbi:MAG: hypothetical protein OEX07_05945 [Gammaproteobacteria bacterium]|nr:hypothetical protein [Gammaproteobacteria bacterium]